MPSIGGGELVGTGRNERGIRLHLAQHLGGALGVELDADVELLYHALIVVDEPAELVLADRGVSEVDGAAETVGLFKYGDIEAALGERNGGFQTGRACADYCDGQTVAVYVEGRGHAVFSAAAGVHGAAGLGRAEGGLGQAVHAGDAVFQLVLAALSDLIAVIGLREQLAA